MTEVWKAIPGYEGYDVSDQGRVRSYRARGKDIEGSLNGWYIAETPQRMLRPSFGNYGYPGVNLQNEDGTNYVKIYNLVLSTFIGPCPDGMEACHYDGDPANNALSNLRWDTREGNMTDLIRHNRRRIKQMRRDYAEGMSIDMLMQKYGYESESCVQRILLGSLYPEAGGPLVDTFRELKPASPLGEVVRDIRGDMNMRDFAKLFDVSRTTIMNWEHGNTIPRRKSLKALITVASTEQAQRILNALTDDKQGHSDNGAHPQQDTTE